MKNFQSRQDGREDDAVMTKEEYEKLLAELKADAEQERDYDLYWFTRLMGEMGLRPAETKPFSTSALRDGALRIAAKEGRVKIQIPDNLKSDIVRFYEEQPEQTDWLLERSFIALSEMLRAFMRAGGYRKEICHPTALRRAYLRRNGWDILRKKVER